jgi:ABC-type multidrug transport system permease subunit
MEAYARALMGAFKQQFKVMLTPLGMLFPFFNSLGPAVTIGYVVGRSGNETAIAYVFVGASLMALWSTGVFTTGWSLSDEHFQGTLELTMTSRTPVMLVMLGKTLAIMASLLISTAVVFLVVLAFAQRFTPVENAALLFVSGLLALASVIAAGFVFAPLSFLQGARGGFFNAIMPAGTVFSGFLYPVDLLPQGLEMIARLFPTAWAMDAVVRSINGDGSAWQVLGDWAVCALLILALFGISAALFRTAERRVRHSGVLSRV